MPIYCCSPVQIFCRLNVQIDRGASLKNLKFILAASLTFLLTQIAESRCEDLAKQIDPKANTQYGLARVGKLDFQFISPAQNPASQCSIQIKNNSSQRSYTFMDDGSLVVQDKVNNTGKGSQDYRSQAFLILPQEKGRNFSVEKRGDQVVVKMNSADFVFDSVSGKLVAGSRTNVKDTVNGIAFENPGFALVELGAAVGKNPKETPSPAVLRSLGSTCQINKAQILESGYDKNIKFRTAASQLEFFRKSCPGVKVSTSSVNSTSTSIGIKPSGESNPANGTNRPGPSKKFQDAMKGIQ